MNIPANEEKFSPAVVMPTIWGAVAGIVCAVVLLFAVGFAVYSTADPNGCVPAASVAMIAASSVVAGFVGAKKGGGFVHGAAAGATFTLIVFIAAVIAGGESVLPSPYSYICRIGAALLSLIGAYLGGRHGKRRIGGAPRMPKIKR